MKRQLSALLLANMMFLGLSVASNQSNVEAVTCTMSLSREIDSLEESAEEADAILKVKIGNLVDEINLDALPQSIFEAEVLEVVKGNVEENIHILQDGVKSIPVENNPVFKKGETYFLVLNKTDDTIQYDNTYWISDEYYVNGDSAVEMFPKMTEDEIELEEQNVSDISRAAQKKNDALTFDAEILDVDELVDFVEEVVE